MTVGGLEILFIYLKQLDSLCINAHLSANRIINKCCPNLSSFLASWPLSCRQNQEPGKCPAFCMSAVWVSAAVLNLLRLEDHLQIVSLGGGPPLKIEIDNFKNWSVCVFITLKFEKNRFCSLTTGKCSRTTWWSADHRLR